MAQQAILRGVKVLKLITSLAIPFAAGLIGNLATRPNIPGWYAGLEKPFFSPPNWVFGPVWTILYILIGLSLYLVWQQQTKQPKGRAYVAFVVQMVLNTLWSLVFFGLRQPLGGMAVIVMLMVSIVWYMVEVGKISKPARYLLIPYVAWVGFATVLNMALVLLN